MWTVLVVVLDVAAQDANKLHMRRGILLGAYSTYRQLQPGGDRLRIAQQGRVAERFTRGRGDRAWVA